MSAPYVAKAQDKGAELLKAADERVSRGCAGEARPATSPPVSG